MQKLLKFFQVIKAIFEKKTTKEVNNGGINRALHGKLEIKWHLYYSVRDNLGSHLVITRLVVPVLLYRFGFYSLQYNSQDWRVS